MLHFKFQRVASYESIFLQSGQTISFSDTISLIINFEHGRFILNNFIKMDHVLKKNISYLLILQNFNYIIPLLLLPYLTRTLGAENFGKISFVLAFISYFVMLTDFGFNTSAAQKVVKVRGDKAALSHVFWSTIFSKLIFASCSILAITILLRFIPKLENLKSLIQIASLGIFSSLLFPVWLFQGLEKMSFITVLNVIPRLLILIATFLLVKQQATI